MTRFANSHPRGVTAAAQSACTDRFSWRAGPGTETVDDPMQEEEYRTLLESARRLQQQGQEADDVLRNLERALALDPTLAEAWHMAGAIHGMAGRHREAADCFRQALALHPQATTTRLNLARALLQLGQSETAAEQCREVLHQEPHSTQAWTMLGRSRAARARHEAAADAFRQALAVDPDLPSALIGLGLALHQLDRWAESVEYFQRALQRRPDLVQAHFGLGSSLLRLGRLQEALGHQLEAVRLNPAHAEAHFGMGIALSQMGRHREAVAPIRTAIRLKPDFFQACITLAATLLALGEPDEAALLCEHALRLEPGNAEAVSLAAIIDRHRGSGHDDHVYVFHHIPKCGGTSLQAALSSWFVIVGDYGSGWTGYYPERKNISALQPFHCLCGHYEVEGNYLYQRYPEVFTSDRYRVITFVRDPLQVKMSLYRYELRNNVCNARDLEDHLFTRPNYIADRFYATPDNYREIIDRYFFIGLLEEGQASLDLLARMTGRPRQELPWENRTTANADADIAGLSAESLNRFRQENELDYLIYEYCAGKFRKLQTEYGSA